MAHFIWYTKYIGNLMYGTLIFLFYMCVNFSSHISGSNLFINYYNIMFVQNIKIDAKQNIVALFEPLTIYF